MNVADPPRRRVEDRFTVRTRIADGGFATVWVALDEATNEEVAIKFPNPQAPAAAGVERRFEQEIAALSPFQQAASPSAVVRFIDGNEQSPRYIATELVSGDTLSTVTARGEHSPGMELLIDIGIPIARAVGFLHYNGLLYLDLKPNNVLLRRRTGPVLVDFNTAVKADDGSEILYHENAYRPPEQTPSNRRDKPVGPWSDVYAVGKLLFYLLTVETMDTTETPEDGIDPRDYGATCPHSVAIEIERATTTLSVNRPQNALELTTTLLDALDAPTALATVRSAESDVACPIRPGDTAGRVTKDSPLPDISIHDPDRFISPRHIRFRRDRHSWIIEDTSLNGTFIKDGSE